MPHLHAFNKKDVIGGVKYCTPDRRIVTMSACNVVRDNTKSICYNNFHKSLRVSVEPHI